MYLYKELKHIFNQKSMNTVKKMKVIFTMGNKVYLANVLEDEYKSWDQKKILITAPTGSGKSKFIIDVFLPYLIKKRNKLSKKKKKEERCKLLILCNRRLLREQYWNQLVMECKNYKELEENVELKTYQQLAEEVNTTFTDNLDKLFYDYDTIVCDEAHYFYADSDFNGNGTFTLLQAIVYAGMMKTIIFMSATMENVKPLIEQTINNGYEKLKNYNVFYQSMLHKQYKEIIPRDFTYLEDYERFHCICIPDIESLLLTIAESSKKSVLFIDNKEEEKNAKEILIEVCGVDAANIAVLNAENINDKENEDVVNELTMENNLDRKILITTSVLDNGVSIHDGEVGNVAIITESKTSFLQMLGRIRAKNVEHCNLYFIKRDYKTFKNRMHNYEEEMKKFDDFNNSKLKDNLSYCLHIVWDESDLEKAAFYKKAFVLADVELQFYSGLEEVQQGRNKLCLFVNEFAKLKIKDMYSMESIFYKLAYNDPLNVIYEQMKWINKNPDDLEIKESIYWKEKEKQLKDELLKVNGISYEELQKIKKNIVQEYKKVLKYLFPDMDTKNGSLAENKLIEICKKLNLLFQKENENTKQPNVYYIKELENLTSDNVDEVLDETSNQQEDIKKE